MPAQLTPPSRKEPLFILLTLSIVTILSVFILAGSKIARETAARVAVFWAILYTVALAIASLLYLTVLAGYYRVLAIHGTTSIVTFLLGVAWAMALAAEALDPNNTFPSNIARMDESGMKGESGLNFRARVGLSGVTSFLLLVISLAGGLRVMGIWGKVPGWMQRDDSSLVEMAVPLPAYRLQEQQQEQQEEEQQQEEQQPQGRSPIMVALARVGIVKNRETVTVRGV